MNLNNMRSHSSPRARPNSYHGGVRHFSPVPPDYSGVHRLRIKFSRGEELKYISHLDIIRLWERALRRARIPLAYSEGFSPHPRLSIAAPLALGITSEAELMDLFLERRILPSLLHKALPPQLPSGIALLEVQSVSPAAPSLQSQVRFAEYRVELVTDKNEEAILGALDAFLERESIPWQHARDTGLRQYDLRPLVEDLWLMKYSAGVCSLGLRLRLDSQGAGRPEQVVAALGIPLPPLSIHRTRLLLASEQLYGR